MRVEFYRAEDDVDKNVVATAAWRDGRASVESEDEELRAGLERVFRATPIAINDPSFLQAGTRGEVVLHPGDTSWFRAVAQVRAAHELDLVARVVSGPIEGGYDPASNYRTFEEQVERLSSSGSS